MEVQRAWDWRGPHLGPHQDPPTCPWGSRGGPSDPGHPAAQSPVSCLTQFWNIPPVPMWGQLLGTPLFIAGDPGLGGGCESFTFSLSPHSLALLISSSQVLWPSSHPAVLHSVCMCPWVQTRRGPCQTQAVGVRAQLLRAVFSVFGVSGRAHGTGLGMQLSLAWAISAPCCPSPLTPVLTPLPPFPPHGVQEPSSHMRQPPPRSLPRFHFRVSCLCRWGQGDPSPGSQPPPFRHRRPRL